MNLTSFRVRFYLIFSFNQKEFSQQGPNCTYIRRSTKYTNMHKQDRSTFCLHLYVQTLKDKTPQDLQLKFVFSYVCSRLVKWMVALSLTFYIICWNALLTLAKWPPGKKIGKKPLTSKMALTPETSNVCVRHNHSWLSSRSLVKAS